MSNNKPSYQDLEKLIVELKSESKLKQSENRFDLLLKASEDMITIHRPNGEYLYYNGPACYAITPKDIVGKMPADLFDASVSNTIMNAFKRVAKTGKSETFEVLLDWLGERRWFSEYIYPVKNDDDEVVEIVKVCRDINQRKIAEQEIESKNKALIKNKKKLDAQNEKLQKLNSALNQAQQLSHVGSWYWEMATDKAEWSDEMYNIYGVSKESFYPSNENVTKTILPEDLHKIEQGIGSLLNDELFVPFEFRIKRPSGEIRNLFIMALERKTQNSVFGVTKDITAQKQFEEDQIKHQRLKAIGEMSASIAHDFNNSLQQMTGNLEVVKKQPDLSRDTLERLNQIGSIIGNIADRVSGLQQFGDTKHDNKSTKLINFNSLIEESLNESRPLWKDSMEKEGIKITITTDFEEIPNIRCNKGEVKSAIYNLIKNSTEAMPTGGDIAIKTGENEHGIFATFSDTGIGMDEETKLNVFNPFFSTKGYELGRGLGMSGVYSTVKKYGGDILVKSSEKGIGTTIEMMFPISEEKEIEVVNNTESKNTESFDILWVDDDTEITETILDLLAFTNHNCNVVNSGKEALEYLNNNKCDIVFSDIGMPEMNGWELASAIKNKFGNKMKIVLVSGWSIEEKEKETNGIDFILQKPFTLKELNKIFMDV